MTMLLAPRDAGARLGVTARRVTQLADEGELPTIRDSSGRRLFVPEDVDALALRRAERRKQRAAGSR